MPRDGEWYGTGQPFPYQDQSGWDDSARVVYVEQPIRRRAMPKHGYTKKDLRKWQVTLKDGTTEEVEAHFGFDNAQDGSGLVFRAYANKGDERTYVVASFNRDSWSHYKEIK